jgi:glutamate/tyrosine decarboxylase-like PLP-dependent enzyme
MRRRVWRNFKSLGRRHVRKLLALAVLAASITACSKTKEGDLEVEKPVVGTVTDTLNVPSVNVTTDTAKVTVPKVEVKKDTANIKVPKVQVKR